MTAEWDKQLDFTQPNLPPSESAFVALAGDGDHAVKGAIATQVATALAGHLSDSDATLRYYTMVPEAIAAVRRG